MSDSGRSVGRSSAADTAETQAFYGRWARLYDLIARHLPGIARVRRRAVAACRLQSGDTVVEMGCGTGANLSYLHEAVGPSGTVIGVDVTGPALRVARERVRDREGVHVVRGDATTPPVADADAVLATFVVGMLPDPAAAVDDWADLVGSGGHVVLANATSAETWYAPLVNLPFSAVVLASTPATTRLRYDVDLRARLDERVSAAHGRLRERSAAVVDERQGLGLLALTGGRIGPVEGS